MLRRLEISNLLKEIPDFIHLKTRKEVIFGKPKFVYPCSYIKFNSKFLTKQKMIFPKV